MTIESLSTVYFEICKLKREKSAVILSHYSMAPELQILEKEGEVTGLDLCSMEKHLQYLMSIYKGFTRSEAELCYWGHELNALKQKLILEITSLGISIRIAKITNQTQTSLIICQVALHRKKSRGCRFETDFPAKMKYTPKVRHNLKAAFYFG
ncbi:MAG: hypothetical protein KA501_12245 [Bacteroidia bacterium]|jgi:aspartate oxidase|nr:hypothetical protein [Bacteroidia bacterium]